MKRPLRTLLLLWLWAGGSQAHPLDWLAGSYHQLDGHTQIEEVWLAPEGDTVRGSCVTRDHGTTQLFEFLSVRSDGRVELWLVFADGRRLHKVMQGALGLDSFECSAPGESLSYRKSADGHLRVVLSKRERVEFDLLPGLLPNPEADDRNRR